MSYAISVYKDIVSRYSTGRRRCPSDPVTGQGSGSPSSLTPKLSKSGSNLNLNLPHQSDDHCGAWQSVCFDSLCCIKMFFTGGLHGASHSSLRASLRGQSDSSLNPSCDSPHIGTVHVHASIHTNIRARAPEKGDMTPLRSVYNSFCGPDLETKLELKLLKQFTQKNRTCEEVFELWNNEATGSLTAWMSLAGSFACNFVRWNCFASM